MLANIPSSKSGLSMLGIVEPNFQITIVLEKHIYNHIIKFYLLAFQSCVRGTICTRNSTIMLCQIIGKRQQKMLQEQGKKRPDG